MLIQVLGMWNRSVQGQRFSLSQQVLNFETTLSQMRTMANGTTLSRYLAKSIVIMVFGSNDYLNNYLMPSLYPSSYNYSPPDFANLLLNHYARQILVIFVYLLILLKNLKSNRKHPNIISFIKRKLYLC